MSQPLTDMPTHSISNLSKTSVRARTGGTNPLPFGAVSLLCMLDGLCSSRTCMQTASKEHCRILG